MALANVKQSTEAMVAGLNAINQVSEAVAKTFDMGEEGNEKDPNCKDPGCKKSKSNFFKSNFKQIIGCFMAVALVISSFFGATAAVGSIARALPKAINMTGLASGIQ